MKVLIAEDNQLNQQLMSLYMKRLGWDFKVVGDGLQAVECCRQESYDLILMDVDMPVLDGIEATRYIRLFNSYIPIIAITAYTDENVKRETQAAGMNAFLAKPCSRNDIYATATACLEQKEEKVA
ncbi:MAG: response regulator [Bacteroidales bacterium]|nr:response regulator [Bacteroidales bacterium]